MNKLPEPNVLLRQTMLSFAYLAYTGERITTPNPEDTILQNLQDALPRITISAHGGRTLEDWEISWGPAVFTIPGGLYQDNMTFIARRKNTSDYVIALRGTNFISQVDWFLEDFEVLDTMPWPIPHADSNAPEGARISESTSIDLNIQIDGNLTHDKHGIGMMEFLMTEIENNGPINICVTGHSLGGVLSNTLALFLLENQLHWDHSGASTVSCISFAAPAGGNKIYADHAKTVFELAAMNNGSFPGWDLSKTNLDNVRCNLDVVPLGPSGKNVYNEGKAGPLFSIYAFPNNPTNNIDFANLPYGAGTEWGYFKSYILKSLAGKLAPNHYTQIETTAAINGEFVGNTARQNKHVGYLTPFLEAFGAQAAWQHSNSYPIYLQVPDLFDPTIIVRHDGATTKKPHIDSLSASKVAPVHPDGYNVTITGRDFSPSIYNNFIVFPNKSKDPNHPTNPLPYQIVSATETKIVVTFFVNSVKKDGSQDFYIYTSSPFYKSNTIPFSVEYHLP